MNNKHLCEERIQEVLDQNGGGALTSQEVAHLQHCPLCRGHWEAYRDVYLLVEALPVPALPPDFSAGVLRRLERGEVGDKPLLSRLFWLGSGALLGGALLTLQLAYGGMDRLWGGLGGLGLSLVEVVFKALPAGLCPTPAGHGFWLGALVCLGALLGLDRLLCRWFQNPAAQ